MNTEKAHRTARCNLLSDDLRSYFPCLLSYPELVYLDSAATTQKPAPVIRALEHFYTKSNANIHRGVYQLSQRATEQYDRARSIISRFISANSEREIVFLKGATEGFNLLAHSFLRPRLEEGDEIIISIAEHHANIVPWQMVCKEKKATIKALPLTSDFCVDVDALEQMITPRTKLISVTHVSNALGTCTEVHRASEVARKHGIPLVIDGAQAVSHIPVDVSQIGCDFYIFSGHKLYGPTGIGVLYGRETLLNEMPPWQSGGDMIEIVELSGSTFKKSPDRFEAGTPPIAAAIGLAEAVSFVNSVGFDAIIEHDKYMQKQVDEILCAVEGISFFGHHDKRIGPVSFVAEWGHPHDIGTILDQHQVAIRTGHHCTQPLMNELKVSSTARVSFGVYSTTRDLNKLYEGLVHARKLLS
jgi:cysteine desulfurase / selenocysteine lyase